MESLQDHALPPLLAPTLKDGRTAMDADNKLTTTTTTTTTTSDSDSNSNICICSSNTKGTACHFNDIFPDEILSIIVKFLPTASLLNLSLTDKRHYKVVKPELFRSLDLGKRDGEELGRLYGGLLAAAPPDTSQDSETPTPGTPDNNQIGRLNGIYFQEVSYQLLEDMSGEEEFTKRNHTALKALEAIQGTASLELDLCLAEEPISTFKSVFLHALASILEVTKDKIGKLVVWIDAFGGDPNGPSSAANKMANKVNQILKLLPVGLLAELHFNGVRLKTFPESLCDILTSPTFENLTLKESNIPFGAVSAMPNLRKLVVSWGAGPSESPVADLSTALQILKASAPTVKSLTLQNIEGRDYSFAALAVPLDLPELQYVQLADSTMGPGSLLQVMLAHTRLPKLSVLDLETENIIDPGDDLSKILSHLPALKRLKLNEGRLRRAPTETLDAGLFDRLREACTASGVDLESTYSCLRCDTPSELESEFERMAIIADTLTSISMASHPDALTNFDNIKAISLPLAHRISVGITDFVAAPEDDHGDGDKSDRVPSIGALLRKLEAPNLTGLQSTMFINDAAADSNLAELREIIQAKTYPHLEYVSGALMAAEGMSNDTFRAHEAAVVEACREAGIECNSLKFISREDLLGAGELLEEGDEEWVEDDDDENEDGEEGSESGESGYGEDAGLLQAIKEEDEGDECRPGASDDGSSSTDESWTSEEDLRM